MPWYDFFRLFNYSFSKDPLSAKDDLRLGGQGISQPGVRPDLRSMDGSGGVSVRLNTNDLVDLSTVTDRKHRYKEYDRLRQMPEIEMAMTVFADEACLSGDTLVACPAYDGGFKTLEWLAENKAQERFLVYCYDFDKQDYSLSWGFDPRFVREAETIRIFLDDGSKIIGTPDHRILLKTGKWTTIGEIQSGDELMPFYHLNARHDLTEIRTNQFPRIFTHRKGWITERQFVDEWRTGKPDLTHAKAHKVANALVQGMKITQIVKTFKQRHVDIKKRLKKWGSSLAEVRWLANKSDHRRVISTHPYKTIKVYDLSVEKHQNFCTNWGVVHNCQRDDHGRVFQVITKNAEIQEELEFLLFHRKMLNLDQKKMWNRAKNLFINGDDFLEIVINPEDPKEGVVDLVPLPAESMYRIETTKGRLVEFQQSAEGPDLESLKKIGIDELTDADLEQATALRFTPEQIVHLKIGDDRKTFYPYGVSLIEAARGPAHCLRIIEDSMVVYRLSRSPERRLFYIDVQGLPSHKAEAYIDRMKDQLKKRKVPRNGLDGASAVEERWHPPAIDEDIWIPIRANANTRVETLPGACLALDTKIPLLDGSIDTLQKIIERHNAGEELWAYSCNPKTGQIVPGLISWAGVTRKNAEVVKVTFDNGESVTCTPDHKFPVIGREGKIQAKDLNVGDSLIPFQTRSRKIKINTNEYQQVYDSSTRSWEFVHRLVANYDKFTKNEFVYNESYTNEKKQVIHHLNFSRFNNNPKNLVWMYWRDHLELHQDAPASPETRKKQSNGLKRYHTNLSQEEKNKRDRILRKLSKLGSEKILHLLATDPNFQKYFSQTQKEGWKKAKTEKPEVHRKRGENISNRNRENFTNPDYKSKVFVKQTIVYPDAMFVMICEGFKQGLKREDLILQINADKNIIAEYVKLNQHIVRKDVDLQNGINREHFDKLIKSKGFSGCHALRRSLLGQLSSRSTNSAANNTLWGKTTLNFPKKIFNYFMHRLADGVENADDILQEINTKFMSEWLEANQHVCRKGIDLKQGLKRTHIQRMTRSYGYKDLNHARQEAKLYNHTVVSVEYLTETQDVGTLTIDGLEIYHNYHTFAISPCGVMTYNSNLGEIDDTIYFRNKLFIALNFPKNYLNNEDVQATRISLSAQDLKFARLVERLQSHMEDGLWEVCDRHLRLRGYPEETYEDLEIRMTPPSDWRDLTRNEVLTARIGNVGQLKGMQIISDFDLLTEWMKYPEDQARKMLARTKIQKLEELKLQIIAQNPSLLGVGLPGPDEGEVSSEPKEGSPMLGGEQPGEAPPAGGPPPGPEGPPPEPKASIKSMPLPEPSQEEIKKYNLDIRDYSSDQDEEETD